MPVKKDVQVSDKVKGLEVPAPYHIMVRYLSGVDIPEVKKILQYLLLQKRVSQVKSWLDVVEDDGKVHGRVITLKAISGRMAHTSPNMA